MSLATCQIYPGLASLQIARHHFLQYCTYCTVMVECIMFYCNVHECLPMFTNVHQCSPMFTNWCIDVLHYTSATYLASVATGSSPFLTVAEDQMCPQPSHHQSSNSVHRTIITLPSKCLHKHFWKYSKLATYQGCTVVKIPVSNCKFAIEPDIDQMYVNHPNRNIYLFCLHTYQLKHVCIGLSHGTH